MWHKCLGHPNSNVLHALIKFGVLSDKKFLSLSVVQFECNSCKLGKSKILPFHIHHSNINQPFDTIHSNLWGITHVVSHAYYKYFITFIDDYRRYSHFTWIYFLHSKDETFSAFNFLTPMFRLNFHPK